MYIRNELKDIIFTEFFKNGCVVSSRLILKIFINDKKSKTYYPSGEVGSRQLVGGP